MKYQSNNLYFEERLENYVEKSRKELAQAYNDPAPVEQDLIKQEFASFQTRSRSFWSFAKIVSQTFSHSSFPPLKTTLAHLHALLPLKLTFLHQPLLPIPILMTKISKLLSIPHPPSQCPLLSSLHTKSGKPFFSSTPPNLVDLMVDLL